MEYILQYVYNYTIICNPKSDVLQVFQTNIIRTLFMYSSLLLHKFVFILNSPEQNLQYNITQHNTVHYRTVKFSTAQHSTVQNSTAQRSAK